MPKMKRMRVRLTLGHVVALIVLCAAAFAGFTIVLGGGGSSASKPDMAIKPPPTKVVPDVVGEAYVFAESTLQQRGFGWQVAGPVAGWSGAVVSRQSPVGGTKVVDTGAPRVTLHLVKPKGYVTHGTPENSSPFTATRILLPAGTTGAETTVASVPVTTVPATGTEPKPKSPRPKPRSAKPKATKPSKTRPPAFHVAGAKREPLDEIPLPERAEKLSKWLDSHRQPTSASVSYWLYQQAWIVTGAKFGWWHGAQALETLITVDRRIERLWGMGAKSEAGARAALAFVRAHSR
jgi:hypothetical protein